MLSICSVENRKDAITININQWLLNRRKRRWKRGKEEKRKGSDGCERLQVDGDGATAERGVDQTEFVGARATGAGDA